MNSAVSADYSYGSVNSNTSRLDEKKAIFKKLTGISIAIPESGKMPHVLSPESAIQFGFFGELFRAGFYQESNLFSSIESVSRRFSEMREELLEKYNDDEDALYKQLSKLNRAFEHVLRSLVLVPIPQTPPIPLTSSNDPASVRAEAEQALLEYEALREAIRQAQIKMDGFVNAFFEKFIEKIQTQDFQQAFDSSIEVLPDNSPASNEGETQKTVNIRGGRLILTFCERGILTNVEIDAQDLPLPTSDMPVGTAFRPAN